MNGWNRVSTMGLAGACAIGALVAMSSSAGGFALAQPISTTTNKTVTIIENDGKRSVKLELNNGEVRTAEIDGQSVPADRIERDGGIVRLKNQAGEVVYEYNPGGADRSIRAWSSSPFGRGAGVSGGGASNAWTIERSFSPRGGAPSPQDPDAAIVKVETPKAMIGVQLVEPDPALRGHFGLKRGEASMIAAVYEGLPASTAGLEPYDLIVSVNGKSPVSTDDVRAALREKDAGSSVSIEVIKKGERKTLSVTPEKYDAKKLQAAKRNAVAAIDMSPDEDDPFGGLTANALRLGNLAVLHGLHGMQINGQTIGGGEEDEDTVVGIVPGDDGQTRRQIYLRMGDEQREVAERFREIAEEMRAKIEEKTERLRAAEDAHKQAMEESKDLEAQIRDLEASLKRLRESKEQRKAAPASKSSGGGGNSSNAPGAPPTPPTPFGPRDGGRESFNTREARRAFMT